MRPHLDEIFRFRGNVSVLRESDFCFRPTPQHDWRRRERNGSTVGIGLGDRGKESDEYPHRDDTVTFNSTRFRRTRSRYNNGQIQNGSENEKEEERRLENTGNDVNTVPIILAKSWEGSPPLIHAPSLLRE